MLVTAKANMEFSLKKRIKQIESERVRDREESY